MESFQELTMQEGLIDEFCDGWNQYNNSLLLLFNSLKENSKEDWLKKKKK